MRDLRTSQLQLHRIAIVLVACAACDSSEPPPVVE
jgi:hypothetical protein